MLRERGEFSTKDSAWCCRRKGENSAPRTAPDAAGGKGENSAPRTVPGAVGERERIGATVTTLSPDLALGAGFTRIAS